MCKRSGGEFNQKRQGVNHILFQIQLSFASVIFSFAHHPLLICRVS
jgi:hypothetical protein